MKVILMGPPGSGKGTQAARISEELGITRMSSGDLFRDHQKRDTELGRLARSYMERGVYVPDDVTIGMVREWMEAPEQRGGFVLDGFPRTLAQAEALDTLLESTGGIDKVAYIRLGQEELVRRLSGRLVCRGCQKTYHERSSPPEEEGRCDTCGGELYQRDDDKPEVVKTRIEVYLGETEPVVDHYRATGKLREVDGGRSVEEVGQALAAALA